MRLLYVGARVVGKRCLEALLEDGTAEVVGVLELGAEKEHVTTAFAPLSVGLLRQWTGGFQAVAGLVMVIGAGLVVTGLIAGRASLVSAQVAPTSVKLARA